MRTFYINNTISMGLDNDILATLYYIELKSLRPTLILAH